MTRRPKKPPLPQAESDYERAWRELRLRREFSRGVHAVKQVADAAQSKLLEEIRKCQSLRPTSHS